MKKCSKCKQEKRVTEFNFKVKSIGLRHTQCKECTRLFVKNHYNKNRAYYLTKTEKRNKELKREVNKYIHDYLSKNPCVDCSEPDIIVLEFDHTGKIPKFKAISSLIRARSSLEIIKEEIEKCEVLCPNCHRRKTAKDFKWYKVNRRL